MIVTLTCDTANIDVNGACSTPLWVQVNEPIFPPLTFADGTDIFWLIAICWVVAFGFKLMAQQILNRR